MSTAFLLLTYSEHIQVENIKEFLMKGNIYVHPKYPDEIKSYLKDYIIDDLVETDWGNINIVEAEINLLKKSFENEKNEWFVLMSGTCFPIISYNKMIDNLNNINLSCFFLNGFFSIKEKYIYKSSQFWILKRTDVKIVLKYYEKYVDFFKKNKNELHQNNSVPDEIFFLTLLMNECNNYQFNDSMKTYVRWIYLTSNKHPFTINKLTKYDIISSEKSYFIRKVSDTFSSKVYYNNTKLVIMYIDKLDNNIHKSEKNKNNNIKKYINDNSIDIIVFYSDYSKIFIPNELFNKSLYSMNIYYKIYYETYILFKIKYSELLSQWSNIEFVKITL